MITLVIRFTPLHLRLLTLVRDGQVIWHTQTGPYGGFANADGSRIPPGNELVALYELRNAGLITVDRLCGRVAVSAAGMRRLARHRFTGPLPPQTAAG